MKKKLLSILLCLSMAVGLLPQMAFAAEHSHCICGKTHTAIGDHEYKDEITEWTALHQSDFNTEESEENITLSAGNYYLAENVTIDKTIKISGENTAVVLCLNGHTITNENSSKRAVSISEDASFTLTDCIGKGAISGGKGSIYNNGTFTMYGGKLTNAKSLNGGGVGNDKTFTMYGGEISNNSAQYGGGVYNSGTFTMYGGKIINNTSIPSDKGDGNGGGVHLWSKGSLTSPFKIAGDVTITGNTRNGEPNNVYLPWNTYTPFGTNDTETEYSKITLLGDLDENARIGITLADGYEGSFLTREEGNPKFQSSNFINDNSDFSVMLNTSGMPVLTKSLFNVEVNSTNVKNGETITFTDTTAKTFTITTTDEFALEHSVMNMEIKLSNDNFNLEIDENSNVNSPDKDNNTFQIGENNGEVTVNFTVTPKDGLSSGKATITINGYDVFDKLADTISFIVSIGNDDDNNNNGNDDSNNDGNDDGTDEVVPEKSHSSSSPRYKIIVEDGENGFADSSRTKSREDKTITLTLTPDEGYEVSSVLVATIDGREIETTSKGENTFTFIMPATNVWVTPFFAKLAAGSDISSSDDQNDTKTPVLVDLDPDSYYYEAVMWALQNHIASGTGTLTFSPEKYCTRAEFVTFLWKMAGSPEPAVYANFSDVATDAYYAKAVAWAVEKGIVSGLGDGRFAPDALCTRADIMCFLYRAAGSPDVMGDAPFLDVPTDAYYAKAVAWAAKNGIASGVSNGYFAPDKTCTRSDAITFLYRSK